MISETNDLVHEIMEDYRLSFEKRNAIKDLVTELNLYKQRYEAMEANCSAWIRRAEKAETELTAQSKPDSRPLDEPCRSCTGHVRENNPNRCWECHPFDSQNYERMGVSLSDVEE